MAATTIENVWNSTEPQVWEQGLQDYWRLIKPSLRALDLEIQQIDSAQVQAMTAEEWYRFLRDKYFRWKYTAANRYASSTKHLRIYGDPDFLPVLLRIKERLFSADKTNIKQCIAIASSISGLATVGGSGLLAVIFPEHFGTVDRFVIKALRQIRNLPEKDQIAAMDATPLKTDDAVLLIQIMRRKAAELNRLFSTTEWTPRKIDMVLWAYGHKC